MAAESGPTVEPPHEPKGCVQLADLHEWREFCDDISGVPLDHAGHRSAQKGD